MADLSVVINVAEYPNLAAAQAAKPGLTNYRQEGNYFLATEPGVGDVYIGRTPQAGLDPNGSGSGLEGLLHALGAAGQLNQGPEDVVLSSDGIANLFPPVAWNSILNPSKLPKWFWWALIGGALLLMLGSGDGSRYGRR